MNIINSIFQSVCTQHRLRALRFVSRELQQCPGCLCSAREEGPGQQAWICVTALPSTAPQRSTRSLTVATHYVLGSIYPGKRPVSTSWSQTLLKLLTNKQTDKQRAAQSMPSTYRLEDRVNGIHPLQQNTTFTLPCTRVTCCYVILEKCCYTHRDTQLHTLISYLLLIRYTCTAWVSQLYTSAA